MNITNKKLIELLGNLEDDEASGVFKPKDNSLKLLKKVLRLTKSFKVYDYLMSVEPTIDRSIKLILQKKDKILYIYIEPEIYVSQVFNNNLIAQVEVSKLDLLSDYLDWLRFDNDI